MSLFLLPLGEEMKSLGIIAPGDGLQSLKHFVPRGCLGHLFKWCFVFVHSETIRSLALCFRFNLILKMIQFLSTAWKVLGPTCLPSICLWLTLILEMSFSPTCSTGKSLILTTWVFMIYHSFLWKLVSATKCFFGINFGLHFSNFCINNTKLGTANQEAL